jgi:hypothetical protein
MALTIKLTPGYVYTDNELDTAAKRNALGNPTIELEGSIGTLSLADGSVTTPKLHDGVLSNDTLGHSKMQDGYLSANGEGRGKMQDGYFDSSAINKFADGFLTAVKAEETFRESCQQYAAGTYAAGVYTVNLTPPATTYSTGMHVAFKPDTTNTGAASINVNGLGNKVIKAIALRDVDAGRIVQNEIIEVIYDGVSGNFLLINERNTFDLGPTAIAVGLVNVAHGMGRQPGVVNWRLRCTSGEFGYSSVTPDEIELPAGSFQTGCNPTSIYCICANTLLATYRKDTFLGCNLNAANWRIIAYARL